ncbi:MAG TPA: HEAT repeat domain-containing protein, partial [Actinomycetota bacterium]
LGTVVGGIATAPLAGWIGAENLLVLWAAAVAASFVAARAGLRAGGAAGLAHSTAHRRGPSMWARVADGARSVRASPLLRWMSVSLAVFSVLYFTLSLLFARAATAKFPNADRLAGFLGLFMAVGSATALIVSLFVSNRLYARFGVSTMILALPVVYAAGFAGLAVSMAFGVVLVFRFAQMVWVNGVWAGAWQAQYNVVPPERRDRTRAFIDGVALQAGVATAGILLILAQTVLPTRALAFIGLAAAVLGTAAAWQARRVYVRALVDALREGNPEVFVAEEEPFGGIRRDAAALAAVRAGAASPDPAVRRVAMEVLAASQGPDARAELIRGLGDEDASIRAAALRGLARWPGTDEVVAPAARLAGDPEPDVRRAAVAVLAVDGRASAGAAALRRALEDPDAGVRGAAAGALLADGDGVDAAATLEGMRASADPVERVAAFDVLIGRGGIEPVAAALGDPDPGVRAAAVSSLPAPPPAGAAPALARALGDHDPDVRAGVVEALVRTGDDARGAVEEAVTDPDREAAAMAVLSRMDGTSPDRIRSYAEREIVESVRYGDLLRRLPADADADARLAPLAHALRDRAVVHGVDALAVAGGSWEAGAVRAAVENLSSSDPGQRANALETLDAVGEPSLVRPLIRSWEALAPGGSDAEPPLAEALGDHDRWVRACAVVAASSRPGMGRAIGALARDDPDTLVRDTAAATAAGGEAMETLASLSLMERVVFLLRVPLFAKLAPADLQRVAEIAAERVHADGETIAEQGEPGDEMFVVVGGEIRVVVYGDGESTVEVARRGEGEPVGEMAVVSRAPRMASLVAAGDVRLLAIDRRRFERILRDRPDVALAVMDVLCSRLRESSGARQAEMVG